jgi:predicted transcriptional regulator
MTETQTVTFRLPAELHERLRRLAFDLRTSMNVLAIRYISDGLDADERAAK